MTNTDKRTGWPYALWIAIFNDWLRHRNTDAIMQFATLGDATAALADLPTMSPYDYVAQIPPEVR